MMYKAKSDVVFGGISLADYAAFAVGCPDMLVKPQRDVQTLEIAGRDGSLLIDNGRYKDVSRNYYIVIRYDDYIALQSTLNTQLEYSRLQDEYEPEKFMQARYVGGRVIKFVGDMVLAELQFIRKPQMYLLTGEQKIELTASDAIINPTEYDSLPLIRVYGTGDIAIGNQTISITSNDNYLDIDCDTQNAFYGTFSRNSYISLLSGSFFTLKSGNNNITLETGITKVVITPRWWTV